MDLHLLSHSVVGAEVNFENYKDIGGGCAVNPSKSLKGLCPYSMYESIGSSTLMGFMPKKDF